MAPTPTDTAPFPVNDGIIAQELGKFIQSRSSTFACGGSVPVRARPSNPSDKYTTYTSPPIDLRWDASSSPPGASKIQFPIEGEDKAGEAALANLIQDCQPASFGYKGEDVLDESYRKAIKMDTSSFSVTFCPYEAGIIDAIAQVLLPNAGNILGTKGVRAELYKLNVYSAPSGFFKAHVDTPRAETQFGSLVVCLPCHHEGGQLIVRHAGQDMTFDWSSSTLGNDGSSVQWAAFYSDCEHEVREVTAGHRVTLTYNLYCAPGVGDLAEHCAVMNVNSLPLYNRIDTALQDPDFMPFGGLLGIYCQHAYAHNTPEGSTALPAVLKGADLAVYSVFKALGLKVDIRAVLDPSSEDSDEEHCSDSGEEYCCDSDEEHYTGRKINDSKNRCFLRRNYGDIEITEVGGFEESKYEICQAFASQEVEVTWLTQPVWRELGMVHLTYGNQAGIDCKYAYAALIVEVPAAKQRNEERTSSVNLEHGKMQGSDRFSAISISP